MFVTTKKVCIFSVIFCIPILLDYVMDFGSGALIQKYFCKSMCFLKKFIREESKRHFSGSDSPISLGMLFCEVFVLTIFLTFLNNYKRNHSKDRIKELLQESKEELRKTNEFLEKWRLRKINWQKSQEPTYLDEVPQEIKPLKLEVPILHMAIIDSLGTSRSQLERGDAGDAINFSDATLLSMTSLIDDDLESIVENRDTSSEEKIDSNNTENNRSLWDVSEEDISVAKE